MTRQIHFLENKFKLALTEKPVKISFSSGLFAPAGYLDDIKKWRESLIEISNPELFYTSFHYTPEGIHYNINDRVIKEGDSFELPSNLEYDIVTVNFKTVAVLKLKTEVRSEIAKKILSETPAEVTKEVREYWNKEVEQPDKLYTKQEVSTEQDLWNEVIQIIETSDYVNRGNAYYPELMKELSKFTITRKP